MLFIVSGFASISVCVTSWFGREGALVDLVQPEGGACRFDVALDVRALRSELVRLHLEALHAAGIKPSAYDRDSGPRNGCTDRQHDAAPCHRCKKCNAGGGGQHHADVDERQASVNVGVGGTEDRAGVGEVQIEAVEPVAPDEQHHNGQQKQRQMHRGSAAESETSPNMR